MKLVITDVSVFFDLYHLQVLPEFFALDLEIHTTNFIYNEIIHAVQKSEFEVFERSKKLHIINISVSDEGEIRAMPLNSSNRSFPDKTVLWKAMQLKCILLTCDNRLKHEALAHGLIVHGSIWVIKQLIDNTIISKSRGIELYEKMKIINSRLPHNEIDEQIKRLK